MYMEMVQDLLRPENANITLYEDPDTKEVRERARPLAVLI